MKRLASTGETADPCGVPRSRASRVPSGCSSGAFNHRLIYSTTQTSSVFASTAFSSRSWSTLSKNDLMSRSSTQSFLQHRRRVTATASNLAATTVWAIRSATVATPSTLMPPSAFGIGTARTAGGKYDPDAIRFQTLYRLFFRSVSNASMVCPSTPGAPLLALTRRYASHTSHFEISNDFPCDTDLPTRILPGTLVDRTNNPRWSGPFAPPPLQGLHPHYEPVRQHAPRRYSPPHSFCCLVLSLGCGSSEVTTSWAGVRRADWRHTPS